MPQHESAKKRIRTNKKENARNRAAKRTVKTVTKRFLAASGEEAQALLREVSSELDRAAKRGVIPKARADRKKSRLARALNKKAS
ncbi:MAG: 30S ribosomal protein S20 [bacterium]